MKDRTLILIAAAALLLGIAVPALILGPKPTPAPATPVEQLGEAPVAASTIEQAAETLVPPAAELGTTTFRALSLRRLEARLLECGHRDDCPESTFHLDDLTILDGYLTDPRDHDVILLGRSDPDRPPLHVEDLAVALRSAWGKYDERRGNTIYTTDPGCSIDPDPDVIRELENLAGRLFASGSDGGIEAWNRICRKPQAVRVMGVPFHSRFAKIMVEADYDMKSQVDGSDPLEIPGFVSLTDMTLAQVRRQVQAGQTQGLALSSMNRFWFSPGESLFEETDGMVLIRRSPVTLLTHQTFVNAGGKIADAAAHDPLARLFADNFTRLFDQVAERRPIFRQLEGLFRFVAVARLLEVKVRASPFAGTLAYLLEGFPVQATRVDEHKPGQASVKGFEHRQEVPGGLQILNLRLPSCGGVAMPIDVSPGRFRRSSAPTLAGTYATALRAKDTAEGVSWTLRDTPDGRVNDLRHSLRASEVNGLDPDSHVFFVRDNLQGERPTHYTLYRGVEDPVYKGSDFGDLLAAAKRHNPSRTIFLHRDMSLRRADAAFDANLALRQAMRRDLSVVMIEESGDVAARPGKTTLDRVGPIRNVTHGLWSGFQAVTLYVTHVVGNVIKKFAVTLYSYSPEALRAAIRAIEANLIEALPAVPWPLSSRVRAGIDAIEKGPAGAHIREIEHTQTAEIPLESLGRGA